MAYTKKMIDPNKIKEREVSKKELDKNIEETRGKKNLYYRLPLFLTIVLAVTYILSQNVVILVLVAVSFMCFLFGWDSNRRICPNCHKWNGLLFLDEKRKTHYEVQEIELPFGKKKKKRTKLTDVVTTTKCKSCGKTNVISSLEEEKKRLEEKKKAQEELEAKKKTKKKSKSKEK